MFDKKGFSIDHKYTNQHDTQFFEIESNVNYVVTFFGKRNVDTSRFTESTILLEKLCNFEKSILKCNLNEMKGFYLDIYFDVMPLILILHLYFVEIKFLIQIFLNYCYFYLTKGHKYVL